MPSNNLFGDWDDAPDQDQDWEPVVLKSSFTRYFDAAFVGAVCARRAALGMDLSAFAARAMMSQVALRDLEAGRLPYDTAVEHRLRALLMAAPKAPVSGTTQGGKPSTPEQKKYMKA